MLESWHVIILSRQSTFMGGNQVGYVYQPGTLIPTSQLVGYIIFGAADHIRVV